MLTGRESLQELYNYPMERVAVVYGSAFSEEHRDLFEQIFKKKDIRFIQKSWKGEPTIAGLAETMKEIEEYQPDAFIAFGGGAVIDGIKLCRLYYELPFYDINLTRIRNEVLKTKFIAIPTTVGSGAEVSSAAVLWNEEKHRKEMVVLHELQPDVVVYDERYVKGVSAKNLYSSILDGMSHIIEGYVSVVANSFVELLGEKGLSVFREQLLRDDGMDFSALQYAGCVGGIVQNHCIVGAAHAIAHQLWKYGFSHGEAVGILLPSVIRVNCESKDCAERYHKLAKGAGFVNKDDMLSSIEDVLCKSGIGNRKFELKSIIQDKSDTLIDNIKEDRGGKGNPIPITMQYIEKVLENL